MDVIDNSEHKKLKRIEDDDDYLKEKENDNKHDNHDEYEEDGDYAEEDGHEI